MVWVRVGVQTKVCFQHRDPTARWLVHLPRPKRCSQIQKSDCGASAPTKKDLKDSLGEGGGGVHGGHSQVARWWWWEGGKGGCGGLGGQENKLLL